MEVLKDVPFCFIQYEATQARAALRLVELMHVAQVGEDVLHVNGPLQDLGDRVPSRMHRADEDVALQTMLASELSQLRANGRGIPCLAG